MSTKQKSLEKIRVNIVGAGFGGLSVAHILSKNPHFDIHIYEKSDRIGGQASSKFVQLCHVEVSWRCYVC